MRSTWRFLDLAKWNNDESGDDDDDYASGGGDDDDDDDNNSITILNRKCINIETSYFEVRSMWNIKTKLIAVNTAAASSKSFRK